MKKITVPMLALSLIVACFLVSVAFMPHEVQSQPIATGDHSAIVQNALVLDRPALQTEPPVITSTRTPSTTPTAHICIVTTGLKTGWANLRSGPGMAYAVLTALADGDVLTVNRTGEYWREVTTGSNLTGWIFKDLCK